MSTIEGGGDAAPKVSGEPVPPALQGSLQTASVGDEQKVSSAEPTRKSSRGRIVSRIALAAEAAAGEWSFVIFSMGRDCIPRGPDTRSRAHLAPFPATSTLSPSVSGARYLPGSPVKYPDPRPARPPSADTGGMPSDDPQGLERGTREAPLASALFSHVHSRNGGKTWFGKVRTRAGTPNVSRTSPFPLPFLHGGRIRVIRTFPPRTPSQNDYFRTWTTPVYNLEEEAARAVDRFLYKAKQLTREWVVLNFPDGMTVSARASPRAGAAVAPVLAGTRLRPTPPLAARGRPGCRALGRPAPGPAMAGTALPMGWNWGASLGPAGNLPSLTLFSPQIQADFSPRMPGPARRAPPRAGNRRARSPPGPQLSRPLPGRDSGTSRRNRSQWPLFRISSL